MAVIGIDAVDHGQRGTIAAFFDVRNLRAVRDRFRQTVLDQLQLVELCRAGLIDVDGVAGPDLRDPVGYFGHSMGAVVGTLHAALAPHAPVAVLNAAGGGLTRIMDSSSLRGGISIIVRPLLGLDLSSPGYEETLPFLRGVAQVIFEPADPINHAAMLLRPRAAGSPHVLVQLDVGDTLVPNPLTEALALAAGLPARRAPETTPTGINALWRLDARSLGVPGDVDPHDTYFHVPAARVQAATYLSSGGTTLTAVP